MPHLVASIPQVAADAVEAQRRHRVPDVGLVVHRRAANVHPHLPRLDGLKGPSLARQCVVDPLGHPFVLPAQGEGSRGRAKIIRPAAVCNTFVTTMPMVRSKLSLPSSTTTIVPSSR